MAVELTAEVGEAAAVVGFQYQVDGSGALCRLVLCVQMSVFVQERCPSGLALARSGRESGIAKSLKTNPKIECGKRVGSVQLRPQQGTAQGIGQSFLNKNVSEMADQGRVVTAEVDHT